MMIRIEIDTESEAFVDNKEFEFYRILGQLKHWLTDSRLNNGCCYPIQDINGNTVGKLEVVE